MLYWGDRGQPHHAAMPPPMIDSVMLDNITVFW
jgi:hypothetical protein